MSAGDVETLKAYVDESIEHLAGIETDLLEMEKAGSRIDEELVLGLNQLLQALSNKDHHTSEVVGKRIDHITSELQEAIMRTRMQPVGNVFNKFPRLARDLAKSVGKKVELVLEGKDVELDKTLIEAIGDPLTHLVRNAIDHGIETPLEREKAGKHPIGRINLKAFHEAGLAQLSSVHENTRAEELERKAAKAALRSRKDKQPLLVFCNAEDEQFAVPLNQVVRVDVNDLESPPANISGVQGKFFHGIIKTEDRLIGILDVEKALD